MRALSIRRPYDVVELNRHGDPAVALAGPTAFAAFLTDETAEGSVLNHGQMGEQLGMVERWAKVRPPYPAYVAAAT